MSGLIREARMRQGVGVRELARRLDVSPATVQSWERADARGVARLATIDRALRAVGEHITFTATPIEHAPVLERREDRVSLELHRSVARHLVDDPEGTLSAAPENIRRRRENSQGSVAAAMLDEWDRLVSDRRIGALVDILLGTDRHAINMRQYSPFAGVLSQEERVEAIRRARRA